MALFQDWESTPTGTDKQNVCLVLTVNSPALRLHKPATSRASMHALNMGAVFNLYAQVIHRMFSHLLGQRTEVDVRTRFNNRCRHFFMPRTLLHGVGNPAFDLIEIF